jgi:hypothetical protein
VPAARARRQSRGKPAYAATVSGLRGGRPRWRPTGRGSTLRCRRRRRARPRRTYALLEGAKCSLSPARREPGAPSSTPMDSTWPPRDLPQLKLAARHDTSLGVADHVDATERLDRTRPRPSTGAPCSAALVVHRAGLSAQLAPPASPQSGPSHSSETTSRRCQSARSLARSRNRLEAFGRPRRGDDDFEGLREASCWSSPFGVARGIARQRRGSAIVGLGNVPIELQRAAALDGTEHCPFADGERMDGLVSWTVSSNDVRQLQPRLVALRRPQ